MTAFRSRPALAICVVLGTMLSISLAGLVWAQQPAENLPFDEHSEPPAARPAQPQPKSAVQKRLEELYKRDGRPLPDYMQQDNAGETNASAPSSQASDLAGLRTQRDTAPSQGTMRQQLSDYYQSQGKTMPTASAPAQPAQLSPAPQPTHWYDRINPFHHSTPAPQSQSQTQAPGATVNVTVRATPTPAATPQTQSSGLWAEVGFGRTSHTPVVPSVELGASASVEQKAEIPVVYVPTGAAQAGVAKLPEVAATAPGVVSIPAEPQPAASSGSSVAATNAVALTDDASMPFHADSEAQADGQSPSAGPGVPYTGLTLEDEQAQLVPPKVEAPQPHTRKSESTTTTSPKTISPAAPPVHATTEDESYHLRPAHPTAPSQLHDAPTSASKSATAQLAHVADAQPSSSHTSSAGEIKEPAAPAVPQHPAVVVHKHHVQTLAEKQRLIEERAGRRGLKGFCPVVLRDQRELADAKVGYCSIYHGQKYFFSSAQAQARFESAPHKYAPAAGGVDVVVKANSDQDVEGSLDFALWYKDQLYLFCSPESLQAFSISPTAYSAAAQRIQ